MPLDSGVDGPASRKDVIVHYHSSGGHVPWSVAWQPADGGIYPDFYGKLWIEQDDSNAPVLVLEGAYRPPLGFAGKAFDLVIGARVASITAREFLRAIAAEMQREHAIDEARLRRPASTPEARSA